MTVTIRPLAVEDVEALSRFLTAGFHTPPDAPFAAPDVLRWKFLDPRADESEGRGGVEPPPRSLVAVDDSGAIVGHVGIVPTAFVAPGVASPVAGLHMIDWLGSRDHRAVGAALMRRAHETASVQIGLGGSDAGRAVIRRGGYEPMPPILVYERIVSPWRRLRAGGFGSPGRIARTARDLGRLLIHPSRPATRRLTLEPTSTFGPEVLDVVRAAARCAVVAARAPGRLNHLLRHPRQASRGYLLRDDAERVRGFALLNRLDRRDDGPVLGRVVDLLLDDDDPAAWHAASLLVSRELARLGADVAQVFASPPWTVEALRRAGFVMRHPLELQLRDRQGLLPRDVPFHLTPIEADYAYT